jgi:hypothetical protein
MAIAQGNETKETQGGVKLMTGLVPMMVVAVNPSKKELEQIYGRDLEKEPEYISADEAGVKKLRVDFIMKTVINDKLGCNEEIITKVPFFLEDKPAYTSDGSKVYMLNLYGENACIPVEDAKKNTLPDNMQWYNTTKMRPAYRGEIELVGFLKQYLGIPNRQFKDRVIPDVSKAEIQLEKIKNYFSGDIKEFVSVVNIRKATNIVLLAGGVRTTDDNKQYQAWYLKKPLKYGTTNLDYIKRDISERQSQMNVDFGPADLRFRIYSNEPTVFEGPAKASTTIEDDPFEMALNSGIPANAAQTPPDDFWNN